MDNGFSDGKRYSPLKWLGEGQHVAFSELNQPVNADIKQNVTFKRNHSHNISRLLSVYNDDWFGAIVFSRHNKIFSVVCSSCCQNCA